jgi:ABC-type multidrug transport system permease subunit
MGLITQIQKKRAYRAFDKEKIKDIEKDYGVFIERARISIFLKLFYMTLKNIKLLFRSRLSALIFILGPLLIILLVGLSFNTTTLYDLNIAVYSDSYSELSESIVTDLSDNLYNVIKLESKQSCIDAVKTQDFQVCLIFPPDMSYSNEGTNTITIFVDNSRLNIAHIISNEVSSKVNLESTELSTNSVNNIITVIDSAYLKTEQAKAQTNTLSSSNAQTQDSVNTISNELDTVDFTYEDLNTTAVDNELDDLKAHSLFDDTNVAFLFGDLEDEITNIQEEYTKLIDIIEASKASVTTISTSIPSIVSSIQTDKIRMQELNNNLDDITGEIDSIAITNVENIVTPIQTEIQPISSSDNYLLFILPTILVLLIMFVALLMSSTSIIQEKTSQAYFRNFITPTNENLYMVGEIISNTIMLAFQISLIMTIIYFFLPSLGFDTILLSGAMLLLVGVFFILTGLLIGYLFNTKQTVTLAALTTGILFLFFSNTILPLETISAVARRILYYNPFLIGENILKKIFLFGANFKEIQLLFFLLLGFSFAMLMGAILARKISRYNFIRR